MGAGYLSFPIAEEVGPTGRVYAVDIQPEMLRLIDQERVRKTGNIELVLGSAIDPKLPLDTLDMAILVDVYHELSHPWEMIRVLCHALKTGGRLVFVEYRAENPEIAIKPLHKMSEAQVRREMMPHPLRWVRTSDLLPIQHVVFFEKIDLVE